MPEFGDCMRILITGYKGFIGQNMVESLSDHDLSLYEWGDAGYSLHNIDQVIHLGAISSTACMDIEKLRIQNIQFSIDLIDACLERSIPIQVSSSASVYGLENTTFEETDKPDPIIPYSYSKFAVENHYFINILNSPVQFFRYFNVYGKYEDHKGSQASPYHQFRKQATETGEIRLFEGSKGFYRDFVPVEKVIEVHKAFFDIGKSGIWNVGTGEIKSFDEVARIIAIETNAKIKEIPMPENLKTGYQKYTRANMNKTNWTISENYK